MPGSGDVAGGLRPRPATACRVPASVSVSTRETPGEDESQASAGRRSAPASLLLLWRTSAGVDGAPIVEDQHCEAAPLLLVLPKSKRQCDQTARTHPSGWANTHGPRPRSPARRRAGTLDGGLNGLLQRATVGVTNAAGGLMAVRNDEFVSPALS
jgi:hypothetical protein